MQIQKAIETLTLELNGQELPDIHDLKDALVMSLNGLKIINQMPAIKYNLEHPSLPKCPSTHQTPAAPREQGSFHLIK